jgi:PX domain-containing protein kinase-like protein
MKVQRGFDQKYSWQISKRYNEFNDLHAQLKLSNYELTLPPKKTFGNMKPEFLNTRQIGLQDFIDSILKNLLLANSLPVKIFLDSENYSQNFQESALQHVSMYFRSESNWEIIEPLNQIGWRFRKQHMLLKNSESPGTKYLLTWFEHGIDKVLKETELKIIFQQFCLIQHEYIEPMVRIDSGDCSTIMIQKYNDKLISLRDYIYGQVIFYFLIIFLLLF